MIAPDGGLALIPFEAIRQADGKYLVERLHISYVSTGRDLMPRPAAKDKSDLALVLADPDYDAFGDIHDSATKKVTTHGKHMRNDEFTRHGLRFKSLPGFAREAEAVAKLLKGQAGWTVKPLARENANEESLAKVQRPRLLYCITHGFFLADLERLPPKGFRELELVDGGPSKSRMPALTKDPRLRSGLALAGANRWKERSDKGQSDGFLTALEVENLDLWGTELVVLSACETGLGQVQVGEGVLGLRRAFQLAGAQTVLASLWKVPDAETEKLMTAFFGHWLKGTGKAEALRQAQLEMIRALRASSSRQLQAAPPLYWAGFVCHGQPE